jgi:hypothetical protein
MKTSRLDDNTVLIEAEGESIIVLYPKSTPPSEIAKACSASASRLERRVRLYRALEALLSSKEGKI